MDLVATLSCVDQPGIVHAMTSAILACDGNIIENQQYTDERSQTFVMRTRFDTPHTIESVDEAFRWGLARFSPSFRLRENGVKKRALILVSKESHCLRDLIYLCEIDELPIEIPMIVSNHPDLEGLVRTEGIEFTYIPVGTSDKSESERQIAELVTSAKIDFIVLARYMQVLSPEFCEKFAGKIINIHHSFLPSFKGARPYRQAFEKGVKIIGATAHFVTSDLDEGPIIEQDVAHISHSATLDSMISIGRDIERRVLAKAVRWFAEDRIFVVDGRTIIFA